jgi:hypothetical protein
MSFAVFGINYRPVEGHRWDCILCYGASQPESRCDCGSWRVKQEAAVAAAEAAKIAACPHEWTGFRDAKVCKRCSVPKRDLKAR